MTRIEQLNEATAEIRAAELELARRIESGEPHAELAELIDSSKTIVRLGLESMLDELRAEGAPGLGSIEWLLDLARAEAAQ